MASLEVVGQGHMQLLLMRFHMYFWKKEGNSLLLQSGNHSNGGKLRKNIEFCFPNNKGGNPTVRQSCFSPSQQQNKGVQGRYGRGGVGAVVDNKS